jgi:periplasmic protein TonB
MNHWTKLLVAFSFFGISAVLPVAAQTPDAPKKNCTRPVLKHSEDPLPSRRLSEAVAAIDVFINDKGRVTDASVRNSSGDNEFDSRAISAIMQWKFKPALCDGKPSPMQIEVEMRVR